jgi:sugar phosphate isomerase/epimerase
VSKDIFGAGRRIQELRNRLAKLSKNTSHDKTIWGLGNINWNALIMTAKQIN